MKATILKNKVVGGVAVTVTICTIALTTLACVTAYNPSCSSDSSVPNAFSSCDGHKLSAASASGTMTLCQQASGSGSNQSASKGTCTWSLYWYDGAVNVGCGTTNIPWKGHQPSGHCE